MKRNNNLVQRNKALQLPCISTREVPKRISNAPTTASIWRLLKNLAPISIQMHQDIAVTTHFLKSYNLSIYLLKTTKDTNKNCYTLLQIMEKTLTNANNLCHNPAAFLFKKPSILDTIVQFKMLPECWATLDQPLGAPRESKDHDSVAV